MRHTITQIRQALRSIIILIAGEAPTMQLVLDPAGRRSGRWRG
jgi:hypothetical protein